MTTPTSDVAQALLADFGLPVVCGSTRTTGYRRGHTDHVPDGYGGRVAVRITTISVPAGALGVLPQDTALTHNGVSYLVRGQAPSDDGSLDVYEVVSAGSGL